MAQDPTGAARNIHTDTFLQRPRSADPPPPLFEYAEASVTQRVHVLTLKVSSAGREYNYVVFWPAPRPPRQSYI